MCSICAGNYVEVCVVLGNFKGSSCMCVSICVCVFNCAGLGFFGYLRLGLELELVLGFGLESGLT